MVAGAVVATLALATLVGPVMAQARPEEASPSIRMQTARGGHTATLLADGSVLMAGGADDDGPLRSAELYDPAASAFTAVGSLGQSRMFHTATLLHDGRVVLLGGLGRRHRASAEIYDPETREFSPGGRLRRARMFHTATLLDDGRILIVGGSGRGRRARPIRAVEIYDPSTGRTAPSGRLVKARVFHSATKLDDGRVLIVGGLSQRAWPTRTAEIYDPTTGRSKAVGRLAQGRLYHTATRLSDGSVLIVGGSARGDVGSGPGGRAQDDPRASGLPPVGVELFDPESRTFEVVAALGHPRAAHTSTLLADGRVLVAAGFISSVEVYDPTTQSIAAAPPLPHARSFHGATLLEDGTVLVSGGSGTTGRLDDALLYGRAGLDGIEPEESVDPAGIEQDA